MVDRNNTKFIELRDVFVETPKLRSIRDEVASAAKKSVVVPKNHFGDHPSFRAAEETTVSIAPKWLAHYEKRGYTFSPEARKRLGFSRGQKGVIKSIVVRTVDLPRKSSAQILIRCVAPKCETWFFRQVSHLSNSLVLCKECGIQSRAQKRLRDIPALERKHKIKVIHYGGSGPSDFVPVSSIRQLERETGEEILRNWAIISKSEKRRLFKSHLIKQSIGSLIQQGMRSGPNARRTKWRIFYDLILSATRGQETKFRDLQGNLRYVDCENEKFVLELKQTLGRFSQRERRAISEYKRYAKKREKRFFVLVNCSRSELSKYRLPRQYLAREDWIKVGVSASYQKKCADLIINPTKFGFTKPRTPQQEVIVSAIRRRSLKVGYFPTTIEIVAIVEEELGERYSLDRIYNAISPGNKYQTIARMRDLIGLEALPLKSEVSGMKRKNRIFALEGQLYTAMDLENLVLGGRQSDWFRNLLRARRKASKFRLPAEQFLLVGGKTNPFRKELRGLTVRQNHRQLKIPVSFRGKILSLNEFARVVSRSGDSGSLMRLIEVGDGNVIRLPSGERFEYSSGKPNRFSQKHHGKKLKMLGRGRWMLGDKIISSNRDLERELGVSYETPFQNLKSRNTKMMLVPTGKTLSVSRKNPFRRQFRGKQFRILSSGLAKYRLGKKDIANKAQLLKELGITHSQFNNHLVADLSQGRSVRIPLGDRIGLRKFENPILKKFWGKIVQIKPQK